MNPFRLLSRLFETNEQKRDRIIEELKALKEEDRVTPRSSVALPNNAYIKRWGKIGKLEKQLAVVKAKILRSSEASAEHSKA